MLEKGDEDVNVDGNVEANVYAIDDGDGNVDENVDGNVDENVDGNVDNGREDTERRDENGDVPHVGKEIPFMEEWEDGLGLKIQQEFASKKAVQEVVDRGACTKTFGFNVVKSDKERLVLKCIKEGCKWGLRAAKIKKSQMFSIRTYNKMHTCSHGSQSNCNSKRRGSPQLVASLLRDDYPGQMETPRPSSIQALVWTKLGVKISYSTALRGRNEAVNVLRGTPEESYQMLYCYLYMLEKINHQTITSVKLDDSDRFKYLFIALGASIEGFKVMRKVVTVDATFLKNGYGGVLVFATAQDPNRHHYPLAFGVLDGENKDSWSWFFEMFKTVVPDSSELVFMSDRNGSLINAIANVFPKAHHAHCIWHLAQNVKGHVSNVNKEVVQWKFMEIARIYTVPEFETEYDAFKIRYPSAAKYLEESSEKEKWARCWFPGERYNIDTSNVVESMNSVFRDARKYSLIPLLDTIVKKTADWFNDHRKETVRGSTERKLVPLVENYVHDAWSEARKLIVSEINSFDLEYSVVASDGKPYSVNLRGKSCSCRFFDIEKYPCVHGLAAYIFYSSSHGSGSVFQLEDLISKYYWTELWALAYYRSIYVVPDRSQWDVPDYIKEMKIIAPKRVEKRGRKRVKRFPSAGERRPRTQNKRRPRQSLQWLLFGNRNV
ncbi:protein FAR-RED ELONGATED HYPOCOTYL 3-like [Raphanus sativus]|uniref:Protein FAR-RED ELONGATED HYPOCOTYL 3-like n=1 Tax=Raphanus sativus TaxID=3726 RepID=A0A6J0LWA5_RAPSA|nr:protein FAR-RED ELONGATED HYPOCOTYL 3-like [Raphanus sativus]